MKKLLFSAFSILITLTLFAQESNWNRVTIGTCPTLNSYDIEVTDGRNDTTNRVYVSTRNGGLYEWTYSLGTWNMTTVRTGLNGLVTITSGILKGDGIRRLYFTEFVPGGRVFEAEWTGASWSVNQIIFNKHSLCAMIGPGRNDGVNRLYIGSSGQGLQEYTWNGSSWDSLAMDPILPEGIGGVADIRNDGTMRVASTGNKVNEYTWGGSSYTKVSPNAATQWPDAITIGPGKNDGLNRIYANNTASNGRTEYFWNGASWNRTFVDTYVGRGDLSMGRLHADGKNRLYSTFSNVTLPVLEYTWNGASWDTSTVVNAFSGATAMIIQGNGRNDDTMRLYAAHYATGGIYEITSVTPHLVDSLDFTTVKETTGKPSTSSTFTVFPNPTDRAVIMEIMAATSGKEMIAIYDLSGRRVHAEYIQLTKGQNVRTIDLSPLENGVYMIQLGNDRTTTQKVMVK